MPKQTVLIATANHKAIEFLTSYFADTQSVPTVIRSKSDLSAFFSCSPNLVFFDSSWVDGRSAGRLSQFQSEHPKLKSFSLGPAAREGLQWDGALELPVDERTFRRVVLPKMEYPEKIKLLIVDDEAEIIEIVQDYFEVRNDPPFQVRTAPNGLEAFKIIEKEPPHCLILDIKMPVRTGVELYRDLMRAGNRIPTVIFIDSTSADDILEIRKWGAPVFVEKGGPSSAMPDMLALVKKLVAFS